MELRNLSPKAVDTRQRLLDGATALLADGQALTSTTAATAAGVSTGTFYRYFTDKDDLLAAAFADCLDRMIDGVATALDPAAMLDSGVAAAVDRVVDTVVRAYADNGAVITAALARVASTPAVRAAYRTRHDRAVAVIEVFLRRATVAGMGAVDDVESAALAIVVLMQSLNHPAVRGVAGEPVRAQVSIAFQALLYS